MISSIGSSWGNTSALVFIIRLIGTEQVFLPKVISSFPNVVSSRKSFQQDVPSKHQSQSLERCKSLGNFHVVVSNEHIEENIIPCFMEQGPYFKILIVGVKNPSSKHATAKVEDIILTLSWDCKEP